MIPLRLDQVPSTAGQARIIIYGLPLEIPVVESLPLEGRVIVEPNYKDPCLKERCALAGATYISGLQWLAEQAIAGYGLMTGAEPDAESIRARISEI